MEQVKNDLQDAIKAKSDLLDELKKIHVKYEGVLKTKQEKKNELDENSDFFELKKSLAYRTLKSEIFFLEDFLNELGYILELPGAKQIKGDGQE